MSRALSPEFFNRFKEGDLTGLVEALQYGPQFMLNLRGDYATIYYKGLRLLEIRENGEFDITPEYLMVPGIAQTKFGYLLSKEEKDEYVHLSVPNIFDWSDFLQTMAQNIDLYKSVLNEQPEKEVQQRIVLENNKFGDSQATDYFIVDTEYKEPGRVNHGRFDIIALNWSRDMRKSKDYKPALAFIEVKCNQGAVSGTAGVQKHLQDAVNFKITDKFYEDIEEVVSQLRQLKLIDIPGKKRLEIDRNKKPQMIFALANYNPKSTVLYDNIKDIKAPSNMDVLFATSSFIGYGMYEEHMVKLEDFKKMIKPAK